MQTMSDLNDGQFSYAIQLSSSDSDGDIMKRYQANNGTKLLDQLEQCLQKKVDLEDRYGRMELVLRNAQRQPQNASQPLEMIHLLNQLRDTHEKLTQVIRVIPILDQKIVVIVEGLLNEGEAALGVAVEMLEKWRWRQKEAQYGGNPREIGLEEVTEKFQRALEQAFHAWRLLSRYQGLGSQWSAILSSQSDQSLDRLRRWTRSLFARTLESSFVVTVQPPIVVKGKIRSTVAVLAAIDKLGLEAQSMNMMTRIISEESAADLKANPDRMNGKIVTVGQVDGGSSKTKQLQQLSPNILGFELKNVKVTVESRKQSTRTTEAITRKYYFLFTTDVTFDNDVFKLSVFSLPFMVSVHGTQDSELYARAFWDIAFSSSLDKIPLIGERSVPWGKMVPALAAIFSHLSRTTRRLTPHDVEYLKHRLFGGYVEMEDPMITWQQFYKEKLDRVGGNTAGEERRKCGFTFWEWLFRIGDMIQEKSGRDTGVRQMWEERLMEGFISRQEAASRLLKAPEPMMLIRFSDNQLAGVGIVCQNPYTKEIDHLLPFKFKEEIEKLTLPAMIISCKEVNSIRFVYPDKPRDLIEQKVVSNKRADEAELSAYKSRTLVISCSGNGSRASSVACSPAPGISVVSAIPSSRSVPFAQQSMNPPCSKNLTVNGRADAASCDRLEDFSTLHNSVGQLSALDEQMMECILHDLAQTEDEEMDDFVKMVHALDTTGFEGNERIEAHISQENGASATCNAPLNPYVL